MQYFYEEIIVIHCSSERVFIKIVGTRTQNNATLTMPVFLNPVMYQFIAFGALENCMEDEAYNTRAKL